MMANKIEHVLLQRNLNKSDLAQKLEWSTSSLYRKFQKDNFSEEDLQAIAKVLNCTFEASFVLNDSGERF